MRRSRPTCGPPTAPSSSPTTRAPACWQGLDLGVADENILVLGSERYNALLQRFAGSPEAQDLIENADDIDEAALYLLIFTSGTTGVPKAVRCTQGRLAGIAEVAGPGFGYKADDVCYCPMPLFHGNALMALWGPSVMDRARPSPLAPASAPRPSSTTSATSVPPSSATSARPSPTSSPRPSGPTTPTTPCRAPSAPKPRCATATASANGSGAT